MTLFRKFSWSTFLAVALVCLAVGTFQVSRDAYRSNLAEHPDEAAHFVSALCVLDYLKTGLGTNPVRFAEAYYVHYPKVALRHWPPMFYIVQAAWYAIAGQSAFQAVLLAGTAAALTAIFLLLRLNRLYGLAVALSATALFLWLPVIRASELMLMSDMLATLFSLLAVLAFCDACVSGRLKHWILLGVWSACAVLTKESALTLALVIPVAVIFLFGRTAMSSKRSRRIILGGAALLALLLLLYAGGGFLRLSQGPLLAGARQPGQMIPMVLSFLSGASPVMFLIVACSLIGLAQAGPSHNGERKVHVVTALIWLVATLVSQLFVRDAFETRYLLPAYVAATMLTAEGLFVILGLLKRRLQRAAIPVAAVVVLTGLCLLSTPPLKLHQRTGYGEVAAAVAREAEAPVVLVSSDTSGEGALVAQLLLDDPHRSGVVLRGTKTLANSDWMGREFKLLLDSPDSVLRLLNSTPVQYVVLDMNGFIKEETRPHHRLLEEALTKFAEQFRLAGDFPLYFDGHRREHAVQVYENLKARGRHARTIRVDMMRSLGRDLEIPLAPVVRGGSKPAEPRVASVASSQPAVSFDIAPQSDHVPARGASGRIFVTAPSAYSWSVSNLPDWIQIRNGSGVGDGIVTYEVAANKTNVRRSATMSVGPVSFSLTQPRSAITYLPYSEDFTQPVKAMTALEPPNWNSTVDPPGQWVLEDGSGQGASVLEAAPNGAPQYLELNKPGGETDSWKTQLALARIEIVPGKQYRIVLRMKAERSALVWLTLRQDAPPRKYCGLFEGLPVNTVASDFESVFRADEACAGTGNRLALETGRISGRLWVGNLRITEMDHRGP